MNLRLHVSTDALSEFSMAGHSALTCIAHRGEEPLLLLGFSSRGLIFTEVVVWG